MTTPAVALVATSFAATIVVLLLIPNTASATPLPGTPSFPSAASVKNVSSDVRGGYLVYSGDHKVANVTGTWVEPAISCAGTGDHAIALGASMDGVIGSSTTTEWIGIYEDCIGIPKFSPISLGEHVAFWYSGTEAAGTLNSVGLHQIAGFAVHAGDMVSAEVSYSAGAFVLAIQDGNQSFSTTVHDSSATRNSAQCGVQSIAATLNVSLGPRPLVLMDFHTLNFTNCSATVGGTYGPVGAFPHVEELKFTVLGVSVAATSALTPTKSSFTVKWKG